MFSRISFKSQPDHFIVTFGFSHDIRQSAAEGQGRKVTLEWTSAERETTVLERIKEALHDPSLVAETVGALLSIPADAASAYGVVAASSFHKDVHLDLDIHSTKPTLEAVELLRGSGGSSTIPVTLSEALWSALELSYVRRIRCTDGSAGLLAQETMTRLTSLRVLNLSHCGLGSLPGVVGLLQVLEELRVVGNRLKMLPPELGLLRNLRILAADSNEIVILPGELCHCSRLEELTLENNRLTSLLLNFRAFPKLQVLHLYNNPLEFLPEISSCNSLRHLSVANMRVTADPGYSKFNVELLPATALSGGGMGISLFDSGKQQDKLRPIFSLMLRRSSGHHPMLAGALRQVAEQDPKNRELMARQENAMQQLVLMALNDNPIVVEQTCATLRLLAQHSPSLAESVVNNDVESVMGLLTSPEERVQLASLHVLTAVAFESQVAAVKVLSDEVLAALEGLVLAEKGEVSDRLRATALEAVGNLGFAPKNRARLQGRQELMQRVLALAQQEEEAGALAEPAVRVKAAAVRVLAILGENDAVWRAVRRRPLISSRGVRILSMDGGGMKGIATVRLLRELEARSGRRIQDMFDLICGTSTGGLLAVSLGLSNRTLDDCEHIYKVLGQKVFSRPLAKQDKEETWMESFYRTFHNKTQHVRAVVVGYKHDASVYEALLKEYCDFSKLSHCLSDSMIDTACLDVPKVALVSTLASVTPAFPFIFRNYELPLSREALARQIHAHSGSSKHKVWQAVRASSAATYYLDDFLCGGDKFQDGAVVANNPAIIALQEARLLWPDAPIDVMVSLGSGSTPLVRRGTAVSSFVETGSILIESACGVERPAEALATLLPLVPNVKYFRFSPTDSRCGMELDEIDPAKWAQLEQATQDYIVTVANKFEAAAEALVEGVDAARLHENPVPAAPTPADALANLRLGPSRHLTLITSASPATRVSGLSTSLDAALSPIASIILDVQRMETMRGRFIATSLNHPGTRPAASDLSVPVSSQQISSSLADIPAAPATISDAMAQDAAAANGSGDEHRSEAITHLDSKAEVPSISEGQGEGSGSGWFSWFSPRKLDMLAPQPTADGLPPPQSDTPQVPTRVEAEPDDRSPIRPASKIAQRSIDSQQGQATVKSDSRDSNAGSSSTCPGRREQYQSFVNIKLGGTPRKSPVIDEAYPGLAAVHNHGNQECGTITSGIDGTHGCGLVSLDPLSSPAGFPTSSAAPISASDPDNRLPGTGATCLHSGPGISSEPGDCVSFLASELGGKVDESNLLEVGACHLSLRPAGDCLVLNWQHNLDAVVEPSDAARTLLALLGCDGSISSLSELFQHKPSIPFSPNSNRSRSINSDGCHEGAPPLAALGLISQQVQWVGGRQLAVLLLEFTLPDKLLTAELLEGDLRGVLAQQVVVCSISLPPKLLLAMLGAGGAAAVVCPRVVDAVDGAGSCGSPSIAGGAGLEGQGDLSQFFLAFYSALKDGTTLMAALGAAESAQPWLSRIFAVHGMHDGELLVLQ